MDKFAREKARRMDVVRDRGAYPFAYVIKKGADFLFGKDAERELERHAKARRPAPSKREVAIQELFHRLSQRAKNEFAIKFMSHPETILKFPRGGLPDGDFEIEVLSSNKKFSHALIHELWNREHDAAPSGRDSS